MPMKLYGKDLKEYEDVDIDALLAKLSPEELEELDNDFDPDNALLPPSQRCRDQTKKGATGPYDREKLLKWLEEKAKSEPDWEEKHPFQAGLMRGKKFVPKEAPPAPKLGLDDDGDMPIELDVDDEFEAALKEAKETDLVDFAGILGLHSMLSQTQYYSAIGGMNQDESGAKFDGVVKAAAPTEIPDEPPNDTDVEDCITKLASNETSLTEVNINNMQDIPKERIHALIESCAKSTHIEKLSMSNTGLRDADVQGMQKVLEKHPALRVLNVESNYITGDMLANLLRSTLKNQKLVELHAENQHQKMLGNQVEMDMMRSIEENDSLLRVGISFGSMEARHRVSEALERNYEQVRLKRVGGSGGS